MQQPRSKKGKFTTKGEKKRGIRSIRLTSDTWQALGEEADKRGITRADFLEFWAAQRNHQQTAPTPAAATPNPQPADLESLIDQAILVAHRVGKQSAIYKQSRKAIKEFIRLTESGSA